MFLRELLSTTVAETIILLYLRSAIGTESVGFRDGFVINGSRISKALIQRIGFFAAVHDVIFRKTFLACGVFEIVNSRHHCDNDEHHTKKRENRVDSSAKRWIMESSYSSEG